MAYAFDDEFNGPVGAAPNPTKWNYDLGRWTDSNELETYTDSRANSYLDGQGSPELSGRGRIPSPGWLRPPGEGPSPAREFVAARPEQTGAPNRTPSGVDRTSRARIGQGSQYLYLSYEDNHGRNRV
jgi:hypothetical protein